MKMCAEYNNPSYILFFFKWKFVDAFVDTLSVAFIISSYTFFESTAIRSIYSSFSQIYLLEFQLQSFFYTHVDMFHYSIFDLNYML